MLKRVRFVFNKIEKKEIIVFDDITGELSFFFSDKKKYFSLNPRLQTIDEIYINYSIVKFVLLNLFKRKIKLNYFIALINIIDPKIIITFIDNSEIFIGFLNFLTKKIFLAIQNANRADYFYLSQKKKKKIFFKNFFVWEILM